MKPGLAASTIAHAAILVLTLVSFTRAKPFEPMPESMPVDVISASDFTKLTKGSKTAPKAEKQKQVAEQVAEPTPVEDAKLKVSKDAPVEASAPPPPALAPAPKVDVPPEPPKPVEAPPKPPAPQKSVEAPPKPEPKVDEALKSEPKKEDKPKEEQPKEEAKVAPTPLPPKKPAPPPPRPVQAQQAPSREFNTDQIKELLDKRTPTRRVASAQETSTTSSLGAPSGQAATLSMSEIDAFRARMRQCWNTTGIPPQENVFVDIRVDFKMDGTLRIEPTVIGGSASTYGPAVARTAVAALVRCQPFTMFRKETYAQWKSMDLTFRPQEFER
ncbi:MULTISPECIES: cell envelope biogenesis protein TolA [Xanthobacter]|uniref:cell envelope biogenesis protein TolA n=1 Tax=Xanthobacter TaxID=279 RepID=UPI001F2D2217|nr:MULTISPECIES: cell envelope biogenesis protein TolA [unclassified Xanthobacter]